MNDEQDDPVVCYLLMRTDLPSMGRGKSQAHAMHAGNHLTRRLCVAPLTSGEEIDERVTEWHDQGPDFGTTRSVGGGDGIDLDTLQAVTEAARRCGHLSGLVVDVSYPYQVDDEIPSLLDPQRHTLPPRRGRHGWTCFRKETTAGWVLGRKSELVVVMGRFGLTPND